MGFDWSVDVSIGVAQEAKFLYCWSRFATRCLKLRGTVAATAQLKLPGEALWDEALWDEALRDEALYEELVGEEGQEPWEKSYPFSDTEEEVAAMDPEHRALHADVKEMAGGKHINYDEFEFLYSSSTQDGEHYYSASEVIGKCFKAAVGRLLPEHSSDFEFHVMSSTGAHVQYDERAYISYTPCKATAEYESYNINVPVGHNSTLTTLTAVPTLSDAQRATVNTSLAVLVDRLGLTAVGEPGFKLVSTTSDG